MPIERYAAAACQVDRPHPRRREEIPTNVTRMLELAEVAVAGYAPFHDVKLIVFPEFGMSCPLYLTAEELLEKLAEPVPNPQTDRFVKLAKKLGVWIQTGSQLEVDARWPDTVFNTTVLIGPDGILTKYRKVNPWIPWEVHASPHDIKDYPDPVFPVADTEIGKLGVATCYDWLFPETTRQLTANGAEVLIRISAYMDPWGATPPMDWWTMVNRVRAMENLACVVAANQGASLANYPPFSWPGGSMVVDFDGRVLAMADPGPGEKIVVGPVDLAALRHARATRSGHQMLAHLRTEAYPMYRQPGFAGSPTAADRSIEALNKTIAKSQRRLGYTK
jgi:predicted amidohydrolase